MMKLTLPLTVQCNANYAKGLQPCLFGTNLLIDALSFLSKFSLKHDDIKGPYRQFTCDINFYP